jgi:hypothetical protein
MPVVKAVWAAGIAVGLALVLAGCGSHYTKLDFVKRADSICLSTIRAVSSLTPPSSTGAIALQQVSLSRYLERVSGLVGAEARRLAALPKPTGSAADAELLQRWLAAARASVSGIRLLASVTAGGDPDLVDGASRALRAVPVVGLASRYGVTACAAHGAFYAPPMNGQRSAESTLP